MTETVHLKDFLFKFLQENTALCLAVPGIFILGSILGVLSVHGLGTEQLNELTNYIDGFIKFLPAGDFDSRMEAERALIIYLKTLFVIWFLGLTVIGLPLTLVITGVRGFVLGFTTGFLIARKSLQGLLVIFLTILPQNIIFVPVLWAAAMISISFSLYIVRGKFTGKSGTLPGRFLAYSFLFAGLGTFAALAALIQGYVTPSLVRAVFYFS